MNIFLIILLIIFIIGTVVSLVRGIIAFLRTAEADLNSQTIGPSQSGLKQNKMMMNRVMFQAAAIVVVIIILAMARH
jgi:Hypoxia induced protein conserved region